MLNEILKVIKENNIKLKKKYGQNFLIDENIIKKIVDTLEINQNDLILEIGPGLGFLTQNFLRAKKIILIEIDKNLSDILKNKFRDNKNLEIINADILNINLDLLLKNQKNIKIISNLPYYISTAVITKFLALNNLNLKFMLFMTQKEVAERILASPNQKSYGSLSIFVQYKSNINLIQKNISPNCFLPKPNIFSSLIKFTPKSQNFAHNTNFNQNLFFRLIKQSFSKRRKTLTNCLAGFNNLSKKKITDILIQNNLDQNIRAESLNITDFIHLTISIQKII